MNGINIPVMSCASSPMPWNVTITNGGTFNVNGAQYLGISGAASGNGFTESRSQGCCNCCSRRTADNGIIAFGGTFLPNAVTRMKDLTDGTTNVMVIGECSNWFNARSGTNPASTDGWLMGTSDGGGTAVTFRNSRLDNMTTINYPPNSIIYNTTAGVANNYGPNNGLSSAHVGGAHILLGDGSCRFISNNLNMLTLRQIATRDDGGVAGDF